MESKRTDLPQQRVSVNTKMNNAKWYEETIDYWIDKCISNATPYHDKANEAIAVANGEITAADYSHIVSPLKNSSDSEVQKLKITTPIRSTDFVSTIRDKSIGEYIGLPFPVSIISNSEKAVLMKKNFVRQKLMTYATTKFLAKVQELQQEAQQQQDAQQAQQGQQQQGQQQQGQPKQQQQKAQAKLPDAETFISELLEKYLNDKADKDAKILKLIRDEVNFDDKRSEAYVNWWMTEQFYTVCGIEGNSITYDVIPVLDGYPMSNHGESVEDGDAFLHKYKISYNKLVDSFRDLLSDSDKKLFNEIDNAKESKGGFTKFGVGYNEFLQLYPHRADIISNQNYKSSMESWNMDDIVINRLFFKSETKIKIVTYVDLDGSTKEILLPADYKLNSAIGDVTYKYDWINVVFEAYRLGDEGTGVYIPPRPISVQMNNPNNPSKCKLPIGGRAGMIYGLDMKPIPLRLKTFQILDNILVNRIESEVAKYQSYIEAIPKSALAAMDGNIGKAFYSIKNNSLMIYDDDKLKPNDLAAGVKFIANDSLYNYIKVLMELRDQNKNDAFDSASANQESLGNIDTNATKGNAEYNIARARLGMVLGVQLFNNQMASDLTKLLEYSKIAWEKGKGGPVEDNKGKMINFKVDVDEHLESEYGIFIKNSKVSQDKLNHYIGIAQSAAQNDMMELAIESVDFDNMPGAKQTLLDAIKAKRDFDKQMAEYNRASAEQSTQALMADKDAARQHEMQIEMMKQEYETKRMLAESEYKIMIEQMKLSASVSAGDSKVDNTYINMMKESMNAKKQELDAMKQRFEEKKHSEDLAFKRQQLASQEKIAKMNKN